MQSIILDHSDDFYHNLLNSFLESARVNPNSFFELRIQNGSLRHKFTTTDRPDPAGYRNNVSQNRMAYFRNTPAPQPLSPRASFYNIPASKQHSAPPPAHRDRDVINQSRRRPPASKRRYIAIMSPPPTTPHNTSSPSKTVDTEIVNTPPLLALHLSQVRKNYANRFKHRNRFLSQMTMNLSKTSLPVHFIHQTSLPA